MRVRLRLGLAPGLALLVANKLSVSFFRAMLLGLCLDGTEEKRASASLLTACIKILLSPKKKQKKSRETERGATMRTRQS